MKYPIRFAVPMILFLFAGFFFFSSETTAQNSSSKAKVVLPVASPKAQSKSAHEEEIPPLAPDAIFPAVIARVNGEAILGRDVELLVRRELSSIGNPEWKDLRGEYRGELALNKITSLINSKLLYQKAVESGIKVTAAESSFELQKISKTYKSDAEMNEALARENSDRVSLEKSLHENIAISKYVEEAVNKKVMVVPAEVAKYYSSHLEEFRHPDIVRTSHILIRTSGSDFTQDKERAEVLFARIQKGEDFAKLAQEYSMDSSAAKGGDMGFVSKEGATPEYVDAAFSLPVGGVKLFKTQYGYHIIKVFDKKSEGVFALEEVKAQLHELLRNQKSKESLDALIQQLREEANIEILISAGQLLNP